MSDSDEIKNRIETHFRLSLLFTRQVGERLDRRMDTISQKVDDVSLRMDSLAKTMHKVASEMKSFGSEARSDFNKLADHQEELLGILGLLGDSSVDVRKELQDLKRRVSELEKKDKAS